MQEAIDRSIMASLGKSAGPSWKTESMAQVIENLPRKSQAVSSIPSTTKNGYRIYFINK
jgi:hypothetical protein